MDYFFPTLLLLIQWPLRVPVLGYYVKCTPEPPLNLARSVISAGRARPCPRRLPLARRGRSGWRSTPVLIFFQSRLPTLVFPPSILIRTNHGSTSLEKPCKKLVKLISELYIKHRGSFQLINIFPQSHNFFLKGSINWNNLASHLRMLILN